MAAHPEARFLSHVVEDSTSGCWRWTGALDHGGYARFWLDDKTQAAHRVSYRLFVGPIPDGHQIDHVRTRGCLYRDCVNPAHLEPVTHPENIRRSKKDVCPQGHPYSGKNKYGYRICQTCQREAQRRYVAKKAVA